MDALKIYKELLKVKPIVKKKEGGDNELADEAVLIETHRQITLGGEKRGGSGNNNENNPIYFVLLTDE